jgi:FkbM family methyltransferase
MSVHTTTTVTFGDTTRDFHYRPGSSDETVIKQIFVQEQYDLKWLKRGPELQEFARRRTESGMRPLVIDGGANIGASAIHFVAKVPSVRVVAVEPDRGNFDLLCMNVGGLEVEAVRAAMSATAGRSRVLDTGGGHWAYRTHVSSEAADAQSVPHVTVNEIYEAHCAGFFPFIVKIDIEGAESDLFSSNTEWLARTPLLIVELHDWMLPKLGTSRSFLRCIAESARDFVTIGEEVFSIAYDLQ